MILSAYDGARRIWARVTLALGQNVSLVGGLRPQVTPAEARRAAP
jgi:hypothetical protein